MAPTRRKGVSRARAAAAASRFKVGDLVLAKVKGFSAWPAVVSEPEKWNFKSDPKKVHVLFFGTQQIAFCSPTDVEAFSEEKKESLLNKCRGKSSDFVRAVHEIIDSYEKLKKQYLVNDANSTEEVTLTNCRSSVKSPTIHDPKQTMETLETSPDALQSVSTSCAEDNVPNFPDLEANPFSFCNGEEALTGPADKVVANVISSVAAHSLKKRSSGAHVKRLVAHGVPSSTDTCRSSSRLESQRLERRMKPTNSAGSSKDMVNNLNHDGLRRSSRRLRMSTVTIEGDDAQSLSNGSTEDNGCDIATIYSDSSSLSEQSKKGPGYEPEQSKTLDSFGGDVGLSKGLDLQFKAIVCKKKRKPNRKRATTSAAVPAVQYDQVGNLNVGLHGVIAPVASCIKWDGMASKENGDEHLPLSKRARVRMGKQFSSEEGLNCSVQMEGQPEEAEVNKEQKHTVSHIDGNCPADGFFSELEKTSDDSGEKTNLSLGCSLDGEAALPPSKRLHRALEAMSANASEEDQSFTDASSILKTKVTECSIMSMQQSPNRVMTGEEGNNLGLNIQKSTCENVTQVGVTEISTSQGLGVAHRNTMFSKEVTIVDNNSSNMKNELLMDEPQDGMNTYCRTRNELCSGTSNIEAGAHDTGISNAEATAHDSGTSSAEAAAPDSGISNAEAAARDSGISNAEAAARDSRFMSSHFNRDASNFCNVVSPNKMQPSKDEPQTEIKVLSDSGSEHGNEERCVSGECGMSSISVTVIKKAGQGLPQSVSVSGHTAEAIHCEKPQFLNSQLYENSQLKSTCNLEENKVNEGQKAINDLNISNDHTEGKETKDNHLFLPRTGDLDSPVHVSPCSASLYHAATLESVADEGKVDSVLTHKPKYLGKSNYVEAQAALSSFESMLGALTRTKESIGQATKIAIDCAKYGTSAKVIEILMCHLEDEQSLHRRVDLFFLVDSIAQCSRSLKGGIGGAYLSAIQVVLPRLLSATAPPGSEAQENRRQCLKVLRLWSERRILPESVVRRHMRELDSIGGLTAVYSRRSLRTERALDDPVRDMGSMLVDEYGSNSSFQLSGLCMPSLRKDEDDSSDSDGGSFEAVTPEHRFEKHEGKDIMPSSRKHGHILEDVDGELEMEDVAPPCGSELNSTSDSAQFEAMQTSENHPAQTMALTYPPPAEVASSSPLVPSLPPPLFASETAAPAHNSSLSSVIDCCPDGVDMKPNALSHKMQDSYRQSVSQNTVSRQNYSFSNYKHYHIPEYRRELHTQLQLQESSSSFSDFHSLEGTNGERGFIFHNKAQPHRPPNHPPSSEFSYVHTEQHVNFRRETPRHCYSNRFHNGEMNRGNYHSNHERIKPGPYDHRGGWRGPAPDFPGQRFFDKKAAFAHDHYMDHRGEPMGRVNDGWNMAPPPWNHRHSTPYRPNPESSIPVSSRGPGFWRSW